ncbi:334_t:CDS:2 [Dentiscutata heterogama]|uniref:334_t:CDS:1 n=1 Tax=Dentiscutata heterogama TaxID=1316150 RepID=A0ACA9K571_9GLOM|nr:334_t:CDS:2 [Dentiscutata heterogama]
MSAAVVNEDIDESWFKNADNLLIDDDIPLDYNKLSSAEDVEFFKLLEADSLKYTGKISAQQEEKENQQPLQQGNETFLRDFRGDVSERVEEIKMTQEQADTETKLSEEPVYKFGENDTELLSEEIGLHTADESFNENVIVLEDDDLDNIDDGVIPDDLENESDLYFGKQSPPKENDDSNSGQSLTKTQDREVVLTFLDSTIDDFRLVLSQDNKYSQEFTLGKIVNVHNKYRKSRDLNTADLHVVMTLQDRFISQYRKYDDVAGERAQNPIIVGDSSPEPFDDGDNVLPTSPGEDVTRKIGQVSGTGNSFFKPSKDASLPLSKDVNDEQFNGIREVNDDLPPYSGDEDDGSVWENDEHEFYDEDSQTYHQTQGSYSETDELYVGAQEPYVDLGDDEVKPLDEQLESNDLPSDKHNDLREDIFNEDPLNDINDLAENFDESSSYYDQTLDNSNIIKGGIDVETSEINEQNILEMSKEPEEDIDDNIPSITELGDGKEYDFSSVYDSKENDLLAPIDDEWAADYTASEFDPTINDNEISDNETIVSQGKRERPDADDNEDANKKARID